MKVVNLLLAVFVVFTLFLIGQAASAMTPAASLRTIALELPAAQAVPAAWSEAELLCLTRMVYGEARNQPYAGQVAVAAVAVNRNLHGRGNDLCTVVSEPGQFSGYRLWPVPFNLIERQAWDRAVLAAHQATEGYGTLPESYRTSFFFHSGSDPRFKWANVKGRLGDHIFYGQEKT